MLYRTSAFDEKMIFKQAEQQARMLYKQILLTRQWASDHNGLFVLKKKGVEANPYLDLPTVTDALGHIYFLRNPAMITREQGPCQKNTASKKREKYEAANTTSVRWQKHQPTANDQS